MKIYYLNLIIFLIFNSFDKTLSVDNNLCKNNGKIRPTFAEIFGQRWENENLERNENNRSDQNSNWQNELNSAFYIGIDQKNNQLNDQKKYEIIHKFHAIKEGIKKKGKYSQKIWNKIERKIAKKLGINRRKIYKWKKEFGLSRKIKINQKNYYETKKKEFAERIDEIKRMCKNGKQQKFAEELGIGKETFRKWKKEFGIVMKKSGNHFSKEEKMTKMKIYYKMKKANPLLSDKEIVEFLKVSPTTLRKWKKQITKS